MKLLRELSTEIEYLRESVGGNNGKKKYYLKGIFLQSEIKNKNGRIYPKKIMKKEVDRYIAEKVKTKNAFGELDHPSTPTLNLKLASHYITELKEDGNNYIGKAKIMDTPNGKIVQNLMEEKCLLGVSSRGLGPLEEKNGVKYVGEGFHLITAGDIVADPSAPQAYVDSLMENAEWVLNSTGEWEPKFLKDHKAKVDTIVRENRIRREREDQFFELFEDFLQQVQFGNFINIRETDLIQGDKD